MDNNKEKEIALISIVMGDCILKKLYDVTKYYIDTIDIISDWAIEFYEEHQSLNIKDWGDFLDETGHLCWDDYVMFKAEEKFKKFLEERAK